MEKNIQFLLPVFLLAVANTDNQSMHLRPDVKIFLRARQPIATTNQLQ